MSLSFSATVNIIKNPKGSLLAFATLIVDNVLYINNFRVLDGKFGLFVSAPSTKSNKTDETTGKNIWYDDVRFREEIAEDQKRGPVATQAFQVVLDAYNAAVATTSGDDRPAPSGGRPTPPTSAPARW